MAQDSTVDGRLELAPSVPRTAPRANGLPSPVQPYGEQPYGEQAPRESRRRRLKRRGEPLFTFGIRPLLIAVDLVAIGLAAIAFENTNWSVAFFFLGVLLVLSTHAGLYQSRLCLSLLDDLPAIVGRWLVAIAVTVMTQALLSQQRWGVNLVDWQFVAMTVSAAALALVLRASVYAFVRNVRRRRLVSHKTIVLGAGRVGAQIADMLLNHAEYGLRPIGFLDPDPLVGEESPIPVLGGTDDLVDVLAQNGVRNVVVAFGSMPESELVDVIRTCDRMHCEIFLVPRLFEVHSGGRPNDTVWGLPLVRLRRATHRTRGWRVKRVMDVVASGLALIVLSPLMLVTAALVRWETGPGVLFKQERVGFDGRCFRLLKFRSLKPVNETESQTMWNISHDDRMGPVGKFLRKTSIDELPQLINILRGDMSIVGPRPERPHFVAQFREAHPRYVARHRVPSGLTGWAQVHGLRGDTSIADRARFDNYYIENWSLWLDIKIILRTVSSVVRGDGG